VATLGTHPRAAGRQPRLQPMTAPRCARCSYTPASLAVYARAWRRAPWGPVPSHEDTRQLGGDAVVDGVVRTLWRPRSPDDRPPAGGVFAAGGWSESAARGASRSDR
jgi:hypothetical protein